MPTTTIDGTTIHYHHAQPTSGADPRQVLYIHGTGCNGRVFEDHMSVIAAEHEVVAIDLPGHGESGGDGFRGTADYAFYAGQLIEALGWDRCVVAGHSLGGGIALHVAIYFARAVSGLMLIDTGARLRVSPRVIEAARLAAAGDSARGGDSRLGYADTTPQSVVDAMNERTADCPASVIYKDWIADDSFDSMSRLGQINVPTLAICGREDPLTPVKYHEYFRDHLSQCELVIVDDAGHWPFVENPDAFNQAVLEFLPRT